MSYYYYFKTGITPSTFLKPNSNFFQKTGEVPLIKNRIISLHQYLGPCITSKEEIDFLTAQYFPEPNTKIKPWDYYSSEMVFFAENVAHQLFDFNLKNNENI
jgi:hypothetical protein